MSSRIRYSPVRAIAFISIGTGFLAAADICMKYLASAHSLPALLWIRNLMILPVAYVLLRRTGQWEQTRRAAKIPLQLLRGLVMGAAPLFFYFALTYMPVAETTAVFMLIPVIVSLLAVPILKERPEARRFFAALLGFGGTLLIVRPGTDAFTPAALLALCAALLASSYQILTRKLIGQLGPLASLFTPWVIGAFIAMPFALWRWTPPADAFAWFMLALTATLAVLGNLFLVRAYEHGDAGLIAPFVYLQLVWATGLAWLFLGDFPDTWSMAGMTTIVAAGLLLVRRSTLARGSE